MVLFAEKSHRVAQSRPLSMAMESDEFARVVPD